MNLWCWFTSCYQQSFPFHSRPFLPFYQHTFPLIYSIEVKWIHKLITQREITARRKKREKKAHKEMSTHTHTHAHKLFIYFFTIKYSFALPFVVWVNGREWEIAGKGEHYLHRIDIMNLAWLTQILQHVRFLASVCLSVCVYKIEQIIKMLCIGSNSGNSTVPARYVHLYKSTRICWAARI